MKVLLWLCMIPFGSLAAQPFDLTNIRMLYHRAPVLKQDASRLNQLMLQVDSSTAAPLLVCYKGANEMIQAKYLLNPIIKLQKFNKGKELIKKAFSRDTLNLEMHFIRYSIQSNLPAFLAFRDDLNIDKQFLLNNTRESKDQELKDIIFNYLSALAYIKPDELQQLKN